MRGTGAGEPDLPALLRGHAGGLVDEAVVLGAEARLPCRLVAVRAPQEVADRRRQKARETAARKGRGVPTAAYLALMGWPLFVTNRGAAELTWKAVVVLYRARWQVELLFEVWESHDRLDKHRKGATALEVLAVFYAKLLGALLRHWLLVATAWRVADRSLAKAARALAEAVKEILLSLDDPASAHAALLRLCDVIEKLGGTAKRKKHPATPNSWPTRISSTGLTVKASGK